MAGRPKAASAELLTEAQANEALRQLLQVTVELEKQQGQLDLARASATTKFEGGIDKQKTLIADLETQLQTWFLAYGNPEAGRKSVALAYGVIGQRTGQPVLKPLNRAWTWKAIGTKLQSVYGARFFHKPKGPEPDKDLLRAELDVEQLKAVGLKVEQEERFYVELDRSSLGDA